MMMYILLIASLFSLAEGQQNANFTFKESCYSVGLTLTLEAVYNGSGTESLVHWSYSGKTGTELMIKVSDCTVLGGVVPGGYPATRIGYKCPITDVNLPANTYRLTVTGLTTDDLTKSWGATFTPTSGTIPEAVEKAIPVCIATTVDDDNGLSTGAIVGIVIGSVVLVLFIVVVILAIMGMLPGKCDKDDTSQDESSPQNSSNPDKQKTGDYRAGSDLPAIPGADKSKPLAQNPVPLPPIKVKT